MEDYNDMNGDELGNGLCTPDSSYSTTRSSNSEVVSDEITTDDYCFPFQQEKFMQQLSKLNASKEKPHNALSRKIAIRKAESSGNRAHYYKIRESYCALHIHFNQQNLIAPAFRPLRKLTKNTGLSNSEIALSRDRIVIDLHYLHTHYRQVLVPQKSEFSHLLTSDTFDFQSASEFACKKWTSGSRVKILNITENIQKELLSLKSKKVKDELYKLDRTITTFDNQIRELASRPKSRLKHDDIPLRISEFKYLKLANGSPSEAAKYLTKVTGVQLDCKQMTSMIKSLSARKKWFEKNMNIKF